MTNNDEFLGYSDEFLQHMQAEFSFYLNPPVELSTCLAIQDMTHELIHAVAKLRDENRQLQIELRNCYIKDTMPPEFVHICNNTVGYLISYPFRQHCCLFCHVVIKRPALWDVLEAKEEVSE